MARAHAQGSVFVAAAVVLFAIACLDLAAPVDSAEPGPRSFTEMSMLPTKKRSLAADGVVKKPTFPASLEEDGSLPGPSNRSPQYPAWYPSWQREQRAYHSSF